MKHTRFTRQLCSLAAGITIATVSFAQDKFDFISHQNISAASFSMHQVDFSALNTQLTTWGATRTFPSTYYMIGTTGNAGDGAKSKFDAATSLEFMLPNEISIGSSDSLVLRMRGWHIMTSVFGKDVLPGNMVALVFAPGIDWGSTKINRTISGGKSKYKNPFVAPLARADLRFLFGKFVIGGRAFYRYDLTNDIWKRKADGMPVLPGAKMTGLSIQAFIGYGNAE